MDSTELMQRWSETGGRHPQGEAGVRCALAAQQGLLRQTWPPALFSVSGMQPVSKDGVLLFCGLCIRCGVHCGEAEQRTAQLTGRPQAAGGSVACSVGRASDTRA
eukprot:gene18675-55421_t